MSFYWAKEVQVRLVWNPAMHYQNLPINDCCNGQQAENVLEQLKNLTAVNLKAVKKRFTSHVWITKLNWKHSLKILYMD